MATAIEPRVKVVEREDKSLILTSPYPAGVLPRNLAHVFLSKAREVPDALLIAEKSTGGHWQRLSYAPGSVNSTVAIA